MIQMIKGIFCGTDDIYLSESWKSKLQLELTDETELLL